MKNKQATTSMYRVANLTAGVIVSGSMQLCASVINWNNLDTKNDISSY